MFLIAQLIGFLLLLMAFASMMLLGLPSGSRVNLVLNLIGACLLAVDALANRRWAFFALECVWALVALYAIIRSYLKKRLIHDQELQLSDKARAGYLHPTHRSGTDCLQSC